MVMGCSGGFITRLRYPAFINGLLAELHSGGIGTLFETHLFSGTPFAYKAISVSYKATFNDQTNRWFFSKPMSKSTSQTGYGLRPTCLSFIEVLSQSVANISPTLTPVVIIPLVFASAGNGTWLAYLIATIGLMLVGLSVNQFAKRSASPGALFTYIGQGLGPSVGFISGWCLILAYILTGAAVLSGAVSYAALLLGMAHISLHPIILYAIGTLLIWLIAYKDIRLSTQLMLILEAISMALILLVGAVVLFKRGTVIDPAQIQLRDLNFDGLRLGLILAIFSYVGYESATALGEESKKPLINIPRAVLLSPLISGIFFMVCSYIAILGFRTLSSPLDKSTAPFADLANEMGMPFLGTLISFGAVISLFACALASVNAASRVIFRMGRHGVLHEKLGMAHKRNETPHHAVTFSSLMLFIVSAILVVTGMAVLDVFNDLSTIATFGFLVVYILISVAAIVYLKSLKSLKTGNIVVSALSILLMLIPAVAAVYPIPAPPADKFPIYFLVYLLVGMVWFVWLRMKSSGVSDRIRNDLAAAQTGVEGT
jgi:amino acid transporter